MNSQEFVIWLKGFTEGVHEFNITPKQWDILKEKLAEVDQPVRTSGYIAPVGQEIPSSIFTSSSTSVGTVTYNPAFPGTTLSYTVTSGSAWSGGTTYTYPNGTTVSYTAGGANEFNDPKDKILLHD